MGHVRCDGLCDGLCDGTGTCDVMRPVRAVMDLVYFGAVVDVEFTISLVGDCAIALAGHYEAKCTRVHAVVLHSFVRCFRR